MMNNHITNFLCGIANAGASRVSCASGLAMVRFASLTPSPYQMSSRKASKGRPGDGSYVRLNRYRRVGHFQNSNSDSQQKQEVKPEQTQKMPILGSNIQLAHPQHAAMYFADEKKKARQSPDNMQCVQHRKDVKKRTAGGGSQI